MWVKWRDSAVILKTKKKWEGIPLVLIVFYFMYMLETYKQLLINKCLHQWINYYCLLWWTVREEIMRRMICHYIADILQRIKVPVGKEVKILIFLLCFSLWSNANWLLHRRPHTCTYNEVTWATQVAFFISP